MALTTTKESSMKMKATRTITFEIEDFDDDGTKFGVSIAGEPDSYEFERERTVNTGPDTETEWLITAYIGDKELSGSVTGDTIQQAIEAFFKVTSSPTMTLSPTMKEVQ